MPEQRPRSALRACLLLLACSASLEAASGPPSVDPAAPRVQIYTSAGCGYCKALKVYLSARDIPYVEHNINATLETRQAFFAMGGRGTPLVVIGETRIHGFSPARIEAALAAGTEDADTAQR